MTKRTHTILLSGLALMLGTAQGTFAAATPTQTDVNEKTNATANPAELQQLSEAFGHFIGRNLNNTGINFDLNLLIKGIRDGSAGKPAPMEDAAYEQLLNKYLAIAYQNTANNNLKAANDFMTENAKKKGVVSLADGKLEYEVITKGHGNPVKENSTPQIHYTGKYLDGKVFDDSRKRGEPISIPIQSTIPGFREGIVGMEEGETRRLYVHPDLGYGTQGNLPPNSLLIFDIEVIKADTPKKAETKTQDKKDLSYDDTQDDDDNDDEDDDDDDDDESDDTDDDNYNEDYNSRW